MLLDPFLYDFVADHQRALREAAERARRGGERGPLWWRLALGMSTAAALRTASSVASRRPVCRWPLACRHASSHAFVGHDV
jgi:hypothetical protein